MTEDDFTYAMDQTRVVVAPGRRLDTFGTTVFRYQLVTEEMDAADVSVVREGSVCAERPQLLTPQHLARLLVEGFGEEGRACAAWIDRNRSRFALLKYGFRIRKDDVRRYSVHEPMETVLARVADEARALADPLGAVLSGVDDGWEVCVLKFALDVASSSAGGNLRDFRSRGLL